MEKEFNPKIAVFHCINTFSDGAGLPLPDGADWSLKFYKLPCSSMVRDVYLLRAFEAGADAVLVFVCPRTACRYVQGSIRAAKRVKFIGELLDEIGLDARRLSLHTLSAGDAAGAVRIIENLLPELRTLGPNPAA